MVLHVGAAESAVVVSLNDAFVGLSKDSHLAAEFDLTHRLRAGSNDLELRVVKWSDASHLEDQDQWWHGGITRSVYLYPTGSIYLADVRLETCLAADLRSASVEATVLLGGTDELPSGWSVELALPGLGARRA